MTNSKSCHQDQYFFPLLETVNGAERYQKKNMIVGFNIRNMLETQFQINVKYGLHWPQSSFVKEEVKDNAKVIISLCPLPDASKKY